MNLYGKIIKTRIGIVSAAAVFLVSFDRLGIILNFIKVRGTTMKLFLPILVISMLGISGECMSAENTPSAAASSSFLNPLESVISSRKTPARLYKNDSNPWIQEFNLSLRAQYQCGWVDPHESLYPGSSGYDDEVRRLRAGWNMTFLHDWKLVNIWNLGGLDGFGYYSNGYWHHHKSMTGNLYDLHLEYKTRGVKISVGKNFPAHMMEFRESSADYLVPEIAVAEESVRGDNSYGLIVSNDNRKDPFGWIVAAWSATLTGERLAWTNWESAFTQVQLSHEVKLQGMEESRVYLDWLHTFSDMNDYALNDFHAKYSGTKAQNIFALYYRGKSGPFSIMTEVLWASDPMSRKVDGEVMCPSDIYGFILTPGWMLTDHIQAIVRYQWAKGKNALKLNPHYSAMARTGGSYVDTYQAISLGFNFYLLPEDPSRFKIMTMAEYAHSGRDTGPAGFSGWTYIVGAYFNI